MKPLRILVADDHEIVRRGIRTMLQSHSGWEVVGEVADGREAVRSCRELKPDLVLIDIGMPNLNGLEATRQIVAESPQVRVLVLTMHDSEEAVRGAVAAGAKGFLLKSDAGSELVNAIEALQNHRTFFTSAIAEFILDGFLSSRRAPDPLGETPLTRREREVIQLLAEGKKTREIAATLKMSVKTAETHRANIMHKLNLHSVADVTLYAVRNGIVQV